MALITCPDCGKKYSDLANACPNCGRPSLTYGTQTSQKAYETPNINGSSVHHNNNYPYNSDSYNPADIPLDRKHSPLSILALIFAILPCTFFAGLIMSIVDLTGKDKSYKHSLAKAALIISGLWTILFIGVLIDSQIYDSKSSKVTEAETGIIIETQADEASQALPQQTKTTQESISVTAAETSVAAAEESIAEVTAGQEHALAMAQTYLDYSAFSYSGLIDQLEYEQFTHEDAVYGADHCGADWNEQAVKAGAAYLEYSSFSKEGLIEQLEYEGFSTEQAAYGAAQNGL